MSFDRRMQELLQQLEAQAQRRLQASRPGSSRAVAVACGPGAQATAVATEGRQVISLDIRTP